MSEPYFAGDLHLGDRNILKYRKIILNYKGKPVEVDSIEKHDEIIIENISKTVSKRDTLYLMGDVCSDESKLELLKNITCVKKYLILGNHDHSNIKKYVEIFDDVYGFTKYKKVYMLSHCPIHYKELYGKINIHGHCHAYDIGEGYFNVCLDRIEYKPISLTNIRKKTGVI